MVSLATILSSDPAHASATSLIEAGLDPAHLPPADHRKVFVSKDTDALTFRDIAALEGMRGYEITGEWLARHPEYGGSPELALSEPVALQLWPAIAPDYASASSTWLFLDAAMGSDQSYKHLGRHLDFDSGDGTTTAPLHLAAYGAADASVTIERLIDLPDSRSGHIAFDYFETGASSGASSAVPDGSDTGDTDSGVAVDVETDVVTDVADASGEQDGSLRKVFVSKDDDALTVRDIAGREGMRGYEITGEWLAAHPAYGSSPEMALTERVALRLWPEIAPDYLSATSIWLFLDVSNESKSNYKHLGRHLQFDSKDGTFTKPLHLAAYGGEEGRATIESLISLPDHLSEHIIFEDFGPVLVSDIPKSPGSGPSSGADGASGQGAKDGGGTTNTPEPPVEDVTSNFGSVDPVDASQAGLKVMGGRVTILQPEGAEDAASVRILSGPEHGNLSVNPDNSLALVMTGSDYSGRLSFTYEVTGSDGSTRSYESSLSVAPDVMEGGWGTGENFYMLQTGAGGDVVVEHGDNHRKVYVSGDEDALSIDDIAAIEGMKPNQITGEWLAAHPRYGSGEDMALAEDAGMLLWAQITAYSKIPSSNWMLFERGHVYNDTGNLIINGTHGESELHPVYIGSYGSGDRPVLTDRVDLKRDLSSNIVVQNIEFQDGGFQALLGKNFLLDNLVFDHSDMNIQKVDGFTLRGSSIVDAYHEEPLNDGPIWNQSLNRASGLFGKKNVGVLIEETLWDHIGWADGYDFNLSTKYPQPPSYYSHNLYLQYDNLDVTFRDSITMRAASFGAQIRSGGFIEDNVILDNNAGLVLHGGNYKKHGNIGNFSLLHGNVVTSGQHLTVESKGGATALGIDNRAALTTLVDNIVAHVANPDDPEEFQNKEKSKAGLKNNKDPFYDDTIVFNWVGWERRDQLDQRNQNANGLDWDALYDTTIQNFTAQLLGKPAATIEDLADLLRAQADGRLKDVVDADLVTAYFKAGFGIDVDLRDAAQTVRFVPDSLGDGVRWDNRLNWETGDLPGTWPGDSVDLAGNWVQYGGTTTIDDFSLGQGGRLEVTHGYLKVEGETSAGAGSEVSVDRAGQVWLNGYAGGDVLTLNVEGGRLANTGVMRGAADVQVSDNGQLLLATDDAAFHLGADRVLSISGSDARIGFDGAGSGTAVLVLDDASTLSFTAGRGGFSAIEEFRSGHFDGAAPDVKSGVNLGGSTLELDVSALSKGAWTDLLIAVDEVIGVFDAVQMTGLGNARDARIGIDYGSDTVSLSLSANGDGSGKVAVTTLGTESDAEGVRDLWDALDI